MASLLTPGKGARNNLTVNGHNYSCSTGEVINVPAADVAALIANGWQIYTPPSETWAARMRRWAVGAYNNNPWEQPKIRGWQAWAPAPAWQATTAYVIGNYVQTATDIWVCCVAGTSAGTSAALTGTGIGRVVIDNTARWLWLPYTAGTYVSANGNLYRISVGGLPALTGTGPATLGAGIADNTATLDYVGPQECPTISFSSGVNALATKHHTPTVVAANSLVRYTGGIPAVVVANGVAAPPTIYPYAYESSPATGFAVGNPGSTPNYDAAMNGFEVRHDGLLLEAQTLAYHSAHDIIVDGRFVDFGAAGFAPTNTGTQNIVLDFTGVVAAGGPRSRVVAIEGQRIALSLVSTDATGSLQQPARNDDNFVVCHVGDSQAAAQGGTVKSRSYAHILSHLMGFPGDNVDGIASTGYIVPGASSNFITRSIGQFQRLVAAGKAIQAFFIEGSQNDTGSSNAAVTAAALAYYTAIRAAGFTQPIFVLGYPSGDGPSTTRINNELAVQAAVTAMNAAGDAMIWFISVSSAVQPLIYGTGHAGATTGVGNADFYIISDGTHVDDAGAFHFAKYVRDKINVILATQP